MAVLYLLFTIGVIAGVVVSFVAPSDNFKILGESIALLSGVLLIMTVIIHVARFKDKSFGW